ncbi:MAG: bacteriohemerythrin [Treponema sp.]|nr:bacteriohemerythrin [Treponema sp.]
MTFSKDAQIISWSDRYATGIREIDNQHKQLVFLINDLYRACLKGDKVMEAEFREAMSCMVEYVQLHFNDELKLMKFIKYPGYSEHKKQHDSLIITVLKMANRYQQDKKFVPINFVWYLKDWVVGHIAGSDMEYAAYANDLKNKRLVSEIVLNNLA